MSPMVLISLAVSCVGMERGQLGRSSTAQLSARLRQAWNRAGASHRTHDQAVVFRTHGSDTAALSPTEFIGRFLQHVLPNQFVKIRHFGLMTSGNVNTRLKLAAALVPAAANASADDQDDGDDDGDGLSSVGAVDPNLPWPELLIALTGKAAARAWWHQWRSDDLHHARNPVLAHCFVRHPPQSHCRP